MSYIAAMAFRSSGEPTLWEAGARLMQADSPQAWATYTADDIAPFARDMGLVDRNGEVLPPFEWDEERRLKLRAKLDALYFILYGVFDTANPAQSRDEIRYIYSTFPIVEREETAKTGQYRSRDQGLAGITATISGKPYADVDG